jgi:hypothetical protein
MNHAIKWSEVTLRHLGYMLIFSSIALAIAQLIWFPQNSTDQHRPVVTFSWSELTSLWPPAIEFLLLAYGVCFASFSKWNIRPKRFLIGIAIFIAIGLAIYTLPYVLAVVFLRSDDWEESLHSWLHGLTGFMQLVLMIWLIKQSKLTRSKSTSPETS